MEYKIIQSERLSSLERDVNRYLKDGWEPFGNIVIHNNFSLYIQPIIKKDVNDILIQKCQNSLR
jgi:hypothetical protein